MRSFAHCERGGRPGHRSGLMLVVLGVKSIARRSEIAGNLLHARKTDEGKREDA